MNAAVAIGIFGSYADAVAHMVRPARTFEPVPGNRERYAALLRIYRAEREAMMNVWEVRQAILGN